MSRHLKFISMAQKKYLKIWPFPSGVRSRLPEHYKQRWLEDENRKPLPVHYYPPPMYKRDEFGTVVRTKEVNVPVVYPEEADEGLWGGEGFIQCFRLIKGKRKRPDIRQPQIWKPMVMRRTLYSEILDRWMSISVTPRTLNMIDDAFGFDYYILQTHAVDLKSKLGMDLKREMLVALARRSMYPEDPLKRDEILEKYKDFIIPEEEAEWVGLSLAEAAKKQRELELKEKKARTVPLKILYKAQLIQRLKENKDLTEEESGGGNWLTSFSPFKTKKTQQPESS